ncbi:hypothetical protein HMPREF0972_00803 [Actinomyces sp. oral taxon 848 str. F0332]|nr:hypothetical protein HMPREF0972_00803 [Actinomyces sp. oral taxon 848 str. F0332]
MADDPKGRRKIREAVRGRGGLRLGPGGKGRAPGTGFDARRGMARTRARGWSGRVLGNRIGRAANMSETEEI